MTVFGSEPLAWRWACATLTVNLVQLAQTSMKVPGNHNMHLHTLTIVKNGFLKF